MQEDGGLSNLRYYQALGLHRTDATPEEVKRAYKRLSLKYHPDRNRDDPAATSKFQEIATAYGVLSSPRKRQIYDAYGDQGLKMYESYMSFADSDDEGSKMPLQPVTMLLVVCVGISVLIFMMAPAHPFTNFFTGNCRDECFLPDLDSVVSKTVPSSSLPV